MTAEKALRADARRNQQQVLDAARELFIERGLDCPLEEVARRAGVGIGTLYRRFGDRDALIKAVLLDALEQSLASAERALGSGEDGLEGVAAYLREMLDVRVSAVIPLALDRLDDPDLERPARPQRRRSSVSSTPPTTTAACRPRSPSETWAPCSCGCRGRCPGWTPKADNVLAHRHLDLALAGLRTHPTLTETGPSRSELHRLGRSDD